MPGLRLSLPGPIPGLVDLGYQRGLPVLVHAVSRRAIGSRTTPGSLKTRVFVSPGGAFRVGAPGRPRVVFFPRLYSLPADTSIYASPDISRCPAQDSRS